MPTHLYKCPECAYAVDENRRFDNIDDAETCPKCKQGNLVRQFSPSLGLIQHYRTTASSNDVAIQKEAPKGTAPSRYESTFWGLNATNCATAVSLNGPTTLRIDRANIIDSPVAFELRNGAKVEVGHLRHEQTDEQSPSGRKKGKRKRRSA